VVEMNVGRFYISATYPTEITVPIYHLLPEAGSDGLTLVWIASALDMPFVPSPAFDLSEHVAV
jgi:hypothetical protein